MSPRARPDLAERARAEDQIRRYADLFANVPVGITVLRLDDPDDASSFRIVARNAEIARLTGIPDSLAMGRRACEVWPSPVNLALFEQFREVVTTGIRHDLGEVSMQLAPRDERIFDVKTVPLPDQSIGVMFVDVTSRHDAEQALRSSERRFRALADNASGGIAIVDGQGTLEYLSPSVQNIHGFSPEELIGGHFEIIIHPDDREPSRLNLERVLAEPGVPVVNEVRVRHRDGSWRWVESITVNRLDDPSVHGVVSNFRDVTERHRADDLLARLAAIVESSDDAILSLDLAGTILTWNPGATRMFGYAAAEMIGRAAVEFVPAERRQEHQRLVEMIEREGAYELPDTIRLRKDGAPVNVAIAVSPIRDGHGRLTALSMFIRDISEYKRVEQERRRSEMRYQELFESAPVGIYQSTLAGELLAANAEMASMLGYDSIEALLRQNFRDVYVDPGVRDELIRTYESEGHVMDTQLAWKRRDGSHLQIQLNCRAVRDERGRTRYFEGFVRDITHRLHLEDQLRHAQKMEAVGRLAGGVAHDFNNLLTAIIGYSDLAIAHPALHDPLRSHVEEIHQAGLRAAELTRQLLAFSRRQLLQSRVIDLNTVIRETSDLLQRLIGDDIRLVARLDPAIGAVRADPGQLQQVLLNLAVNARDAMPEGGTLTIESAPIDLGGPESRAPRTGHAASHVQLTVSDTGIGMDAATLSRVFEPFFTTKDVGKGTGLGLSTAFGIIEQSGGHLRAHSEVGRGTVFLIDLPCVAPVPEASTAAEPGEIRARGSGAVLVAEDDLAVRELVRRILVANGYVVLEASNAAEALVRSRAHPGPIRLLLTDLVMPGGRVSEMATVLRVERPDLRVVFMSGYREPPVDRTAFERGEHFLQKPFTPEGLLDTLSAALAPLPA